MVAELPRGNIGAFLTGVIGETPYERLRGNPPWGVSQYGRPSETRKTANTSAREKRKGDIV
jgi:hypothetical protein